LTAQIKDENKTPKVSVNTIDPDEIAKNILAFLQAEKKLLDGGN
jgi:hypothetical protein